MSSSKKNENQLNLLLFNNSPRNYSIDQNESQQQIMSMQNENLYDGVDQLENKYDFDNHLSSDNADHYEFPQVNGISQEFSQQLSQSSMMVSSRHDDDSRDYKYYQDKRMRNLLQNKKKEEIMLNEALDKQISSLKQELQIKSLDISRLQANLKGCEKKVKDKESQICKLQVIIQQKNNEIEQLKQDKIINLKLLQKRDDCFRRMSEQTKIINDQRAELERAVEGLKIENDELSARIQQLNRNLAIYTEPDRKLFDFKGYGHQQYESPINSKKNSIHDKTEKELQRIKKEKNAIEVQLNAIQEKLEDRQNRSRQVQEDNRKKLSIKDKKIQELQQKLAQMKEETVRNKNQLDVNLQKANSNLNSKNKQITSLNEKIAQNEKRIRSLLDESRKKDEKVRDLNLQILDKNKILNQRNKQLQDMKIKQEFDHHLVSEKDEQIQILIQQKKQLVQQLDIQKSDKRDKLEKIDKVDKLKRQRDQQKQKKQFELLKKNYESLEKEKQETSNNLKECKKKLQEITKQLKSTKSSCTQLQASIKTKETEAQILKQKTDKALKELNDTKKKADLIPQLRNKIIILQNRLKQNESIMKQSCDLSQFSTLQDKIQALQAKLFERDQQLKNLKYMVKANTIQTSDEHDEDLQYLELELEQKEKIIEGLSQQLQEKDELIEQMKKELTFKDNTLEFTHKVLVDSEKEKIELEQQKKILEDMISSNSFQGNKKSVQFYDGQIEMLQNKIYQLQQRLRDQDEMDRQKQYENRQLKLQIKEYKEALLTRQKKITPQTMSQQETVTFLLKTIKKVNRSADMLRLLAKNRELKDLITRMSQQLRLTHESRQ